MKPQSWLRRNWMWAAGGALLGVHLFTWLLQTSMKRAVRSETALKNKTTDQNQS